MAKAKKESLSERLAKKRGELSLTWFDRLSPDFQKELLQLRSDYHAGKFPGWSLRAMFDWLKDASEHGDNALTAGRTVFLVWIREGK